MATIATTTNASPFQYPGMTLLGRNSASNISICLVKASTADNYTFYKSTDSGGTWASLVTVVRTNLVDVGQIFVDIYGWCFWAYRTNESSQDRIYFRLLNTQDGTFTSTEVLLDSPGNGGVAGAYYSGIDLRSHYVANEQAHYVAVAVGTNIGANQGVTLLGYRGGANNGIISGTRQWLHAGTAGRVGPSIDLEHSGDGYSGTPNLWLCYGRTHMKIVKVPWTGAGWSGSVGETLIYSNVGNVNQMCARWDGSRFMMCQPDPVNTSQVMVHERDRANSKTTVYRTANHTTGVVRNATMAYDNSTGNLRTWAVGTSTAVLYQADFTRAGTSFSAWGSTGLAAILGTNADNYGAKRSSYADARWGLYTAASGAPNTLTYTPVALSYSPNTPTWVTPTNGAAADVAVALPLSWNFTDRDPGDTQSAYAVSRQVGAGALGFWRASDSTWQVAEVQNTSSSTALTLGSGWALASDATYTYKVKVWDFSNNPSGYSAGLMVVPSTPVNPVITSPTTAQVIGSSQLPVTWTAAEQTQWRLLLTVTAGGQQLYDSGWIGDTTSRSYLIPYTLVTGLALTVTLYTANLEGLASAAVTKTFTTNFTGPPAATLVATPTPASGYTAVALTNPAPSGAQPAFGTQEVWRRPIGTGQTVLNTNPFFEADATGWATTSCTFARSTSQFHQGAASALLTPAGAVADTYATSTPHYVLPAGTTAMTAQAWFRPATALKPISIYLVWYDNADALLSFTQITAPSVATTWLFLAVTAAPVASAARVGIGVGMSSTPAATDTVFVDEAELITADTGVGVRVGAGLATAVTVNDWWAVSGVPYEYRAIVYGTTGVATPGAWTA